MHVGNIDMLNEVFITRSTSLHSHSTSVLSLVFSKGCSLDISEVRDCDHHILVRIEVFRIELLSRESDLRSSLVTVLLLHLHCLILDDAHLEINVREHILAVSDELHELVILALELLSFESGELTEPHLDNGSSLRFRESECRHELSLCLFHRLGCSDYSDDLIDHIKSLEESLEDMSPLLSLIKIELCPAKNHLVTMLHKVLDEVLEVERTRTSVYKGDIVHREA